MRSTARGERGLCLRRRGAGGSSCGTAWEEVPRDPSLQLRLTTSVLARKGDAGPATPPRLNEQENTSTAKKLHEEWTITF